MRLFWLLVLVGVCVGAWLVLRPAQDHPPEVGGLESPEVEADPGEPALVGQAPTGTPASLTTGRFPFKGRVVDEDGAALPGITVEVVLRNRSVMAPSHVGAWGKAWVGRAAASQIVLEGQLPEGEVVGTVVSGPGGWFEGSVSEAGDYRLTARVDLPLLGGTAFVEAGEYARPRAPVKLVVLRSLPLRGRVETSRGEPVHGVVAASAEGWGGHVPTTSDGAFAFAGAPRGEVSLEVRVPGRLVFGLKCEVPLDGPLVLVVPAGDGVLHGKVTSVDGLPIPGAHVTVMWPTASQLNLNSVAVTDTEGNYTMDGLPPSRASFWSVGAAGYMPQHFMAGREGTPDVTVAEGQSVRLDMRLDRGSAVEGRVTWRETGEPVSGARVELLGFDRLSEPTYAMTDAAGRYRLEMLHVGNGFLLVSHDGAFDPVMEPLLATTRYVRPEDAPAALRVRIQGPGEVIERDLELAHGAVVRGRVVDGADLPVSGARILVQRHGASGSRAAWGLGSAGDDACAISSEDGSFEARGLGPRPDHVLTASVEGRVGLPSDFVDTTHGDADDIVLRVVAGARLEGQVLDAAGGPAAQAGIVLYAMPAGYHGPRAFRSDENGHFELDALAPGTYELGGVLEDAKGRLAVANLALGEHRTGLLLHLHMARVVAGHVIGPGIRPVAEMELQLRSLSQPGVSARTETDEEGTFRFEVEYDGDAEVLAGDGTVLRRVTPPNEHVLIRYEPPPTRHLRGTLQMADGSTISRARLYVMHIGDGASEVFPVKGGSFDVEVRAAPPWEVRVEEVRSERGPIAFVPALFRVEDPDQPLEIRLEVGDAVEGRVVDPEGVGVPEVEVRVGGTKRTMSDADGAWRIAGLGTEPVILTWVPPPPFAPPTPRWVRSGDGPLDVVVVSGATLRGRVVMAGGQPPAATVVTATWDAQGRTAGGRAYAQAEAGGQFSFRALPPGIRVDLRASVLLSRGSELGYAGAWVREVPSSASDVEVPLVVQATIEGHVVDGQGNPLPGVRLLSADPIAGARGADATSSDGRFRIVGLVPGPQRFLVQRPGLRHVVTIELTAPDGDATVVLDDVGTIVGRVTGGTVLEGASIACLGDPRDGKARALLMGRCEADGSFKLEGLPVGRSWTLLAMSATEARCARVEDVATGASGVEIALDDGYVIEGRVTWEGQPVRHAQLRFTSATWVGHAFTAADGTFRSPGLPAGTYEVRAHDRMTYFVDHALEGVSAGTQGLVIELAPGAR